jgi:hypothetical protein
MNRIGSRGVEPYPVGFAFDHVIDADHDGRPDLVDADYFHATGPCGLAGETLRGPRLLVHALPGGAFTMSDAVARRWAAAQCERPGSPPYGTSEEAGCARLWGKSPGEIFAAVPVGGQCGMQSRELVRELVARDPPFPTLDRDTPARR